MTPLTTSYKPPQGSQKPEQKPPRQLPTVRHKTSRQQEPELKDGHIILHQAPNFYVRTTNRLGRRTNPLRKRTGHTTLLPKVTPEQEQRIAASETHLMPQVETINPFQQTFPIPAWLEAIIVTLGLLAGFAAHAYNIFSFPHYELDEGTYMASAWAIIHGMITPYPYGYGHPPVGWIQIAAWIRLIGGFFTFGNAINSGRILMLLYAAGSSLLVYLLIRRFEGSRGAGLLAMVIFSLSPISIIYQRQVFLDNIGTFWLLLSLYFIIVSESRLLYTVYAALCFGISMLSKEIFVLFIPAMIYAVWLHTTRFQRKFSLVAFTYTIISLGSSFVLMAILKGELFPAGMLPWDHHPHLSMLDTFFQQTQRSQSEGSFSVSWAAWTESDSLLIAFSILAPLFNLILGWWKRSRLPFRSAETQSSRDRGVAERHKKRLLALLAVSFWVLLIRGGVVFPFYIIPLLPLVAFNAAAAISTILKEIGKITRSDMLRVFLLIAVIIAILSYDVKQVSSYSNQQPTRAQTNALIWIRNHVPLSAMLVINSYFYTDLHEPGGEGVGNGAIYPYAHIYWNVAYDPELHNGLLKNDWRRIDYIVTDPTMLNDMRTRGGSMSVLDQSLHHSVLLAEFQAQDRDQLVDIRIYQVIHNNH